MTAVLHKSYEAKVAPLPDQDGQTGRFSAVVSVFNNVDLVGDRVLPGAFDKSLESWRESGDPIPVSYSHDWSPFGIIGWADPGNVKETERGLEVIGHLDIDTNPTAAQVYSLMKRRIVREFSFSYAVEDEVQAKDEANNLKQVDLIEFGPTLKGANPATELLAVKDVSATEALGTAYVDVIPRLNWPLAEKMASAHWGPGITVTEARALPDFPQKAGRTLSAKNESDLRQAADLITRVLQSVGTPPDDTSKETAKAEEPEGAKAEEPEPDSEFDRIRARLAEASARKGA